MSALDDFVRRVPTFSSLAHSDKIKHFAWFLHTRSGQEAFKVADVRRCYESSHLDPPANLLRSVDALTEKRPPDLLKVGAAYRLHARVRAEFEAKFGKPAVVIEVEAALATLPERLRAESERAFLEETLVCYRHQAFRAATVMAWNLAYDHLLNWIIADSIRLAAFNAGIGKRNPRKSHITITRREDFEDLKEDEVIDVAGALPDITANMKRVLKEKLGRRNTYAHPSSNTISRAQVDDMITDLVNNVVLRLA